MNNLPGKKNENFLTTIARNYHFDLEKIDEFIAGIVLTGNEIKSIRLRNVSIKEAYAVVRNEEAFILNMHIAPYHNANSMTSGNFDTVRKRKLLLKKNEIRKLSRLMREKSLVIIPTRLFFNQKG